ncbi:MAG: porin family protein [Bacteroidales bacterium]|jgi:hypothetical protein|nr:porin family protein [Bacteroidales bacterium]
MKKVFLMTVAVVLVTMNVNAQNKDNFWIGGSFGFASSKFDGTGNTGNSFTIHPEFGYNISDRWGIGLRAGIEQVSAESTYSYNENQVFSIAPFARYTFLKWNILNIFADGGFIYSSADGEPDIIEHVYPDNKIKHGDIFINAGFSLQLTKRFALTGSTNIFDVGYTNISPSPYNGINDTYIWSASLNPPFNLNNFTFGFNFTF